MESCRAQADGRDGRDRAAAYTSDVPLCSCPRDRLCDGCLESGFDQLKGVGACRGEAWAMRVAARVGRSRPWPSYEGRAAELAATQVEDLTADPRLRALLAAQVAGWAARWWNA